jgi:hypothetical protein
MTSSDTGLLQKLKVLRFLCYWRVLMPCHVQVTSGYGYDFMLSFFLLQKKPGGITESEVVENRKCHRFASSQGLADHIA